MWWEEFCSLSTELVTSQPDAEVKAVGVPGMGPCLALVDGEYRPVRPAILYGVDTRATEEIAEWKAELGGDDAPCVPGHADHPGRRPEGGMGGASRTGRLRTRRFFMPARVGYIYSTGACCADQSASQSTPCTTSSNVSGTALGLTALLPDRASRTEVGRGRGRPGHRKRCLAGCRSASAWRRHD